MNSEEQKSLQFTPREAEDIEHYGSVCMIIRDLAMMLDVIGVAASNGSACSSGTGKPSHVLTAMGLDQEGAAGSLRFSLGMETTREEIDFTIGAVAEAVRSLREARS